MYSIQYHAINGEDGGTIKGGFESVEAAKAWAAANIDLSEYTDDVVAVYDDEDYGDKVEDLN